MLSTAFLFAKCQQSLFHTTAQQYTIAIATWGRTLQADVATPQQCVQSDKLCNAAWFWKQAGCLSGTSMKLHGRWTAMQPFSDIHKTASIKLQVQARLC